jgi:hypothetical protein
LTDVVTQRPAAAVAADDPFAEAALAGLPEGGGWTVVVPTSARRPVEKFNPFHDSLGQFTGPGGGHEGRIAELLGDGAVVNLAGAHEEHAAQIASAFSRVAAVAPNVLREIRAVRISHVEGDGDGGEMPVVAEYRVADRSITFSRRWMADPAKMAAEQKASERPNLDGRRFHPAGCGGVEGLALHEIGHAAQVALVNNPQYRTWLNQARDRLSTITGYAWRGYVEDGTVKEGVSEAFAASFLGGKFTTPHDAHGLRNVLEGREYWERSGEVTKAAEAQLPPSPGGRGWGCRVVGRTVVVKINRFHDALGRFAAKPGGMATVRIPGVGAATAAPAHLLPPEGPHHVPQAVLAKLPYNAAKLRQQHGVDTRWDPEWEVEWSANRMANHETPSMPMQVAFHAHRDGGHVEAVLMPGTWDPAARTGVVKVIGRDRDGNELFTSHGQKLYKIASMRELAVQASHHYEAMKVAREVASIDPNRRNPHAPDVPSFTSAAEAHTWWKAQGHRAELDLGGVHPQHLQDVVAGLHSAYAEHGALMSGLRSVRCDVDEYLKNKPQTWAYVGTHAVTVPHPTLEHRRVMQPYRGESEMVLNRRYFGERHGLDDALAHSESSGWHPAGTNTAFGIVRHEAAHSMQRVLEYMTIDPSGVAEPYRRWAQHATTTAELMAVSGYAMDSWRANGHTREGFAELVAAQAVHGRDWRKLPTYHKVAELPGILDGVKDGLRQMGIGDDAAKAGRGT